MTQSRSKSHIQGLTCARFQGCAYHQAQQQGWLLGGPAGEAGSRARSPAVERPLARVTPAATAINLQTQLADRQQKVVMLASTAYKQAMTGIHLQQSRLVIMHCTSPHSNSGCHGNFANKILKRCTPDPCDNASYGFKVHACSAIARVAMLCYILFTITAQVTAWEVAYRAEVVDMVDT